MPRSPLLVILRGLPPLSCQQGDKICHCDSVTSQTDPDPGAWPWNPEEAASVGQLARVWGTPVQVDRPFAKVTGFLTLHIISLSLSGSHALVSSIPSIPTTPHPYFGSILRSRVMTLRW